MPSKKTRESEVPTSLHPNGLSFVGHKPGRNGKQVHTCKLNEKRWRKINTPTYVDGMSIREARELWFTYLRLLNPR